MHLGDYILILIIAMGVIASIRFVYKQKKKGGSCLGCSGGCASCQQKCDKKRNNPLNFLKKIEDWKDNSKK